MSGQAGSSRGSTWASDDDMMIFSIVVIVVGLGLLAYLAWSSYHGEISAVVISWRRWEIGILSRFTDNFAVADRQMEAANPHAVSIAALYRISHAIGTAWRLPACAVMALLGGLCMLRAAPSRYRRRLDLSRLSSELEQSFATAGAFNDRGLQLVSPLEGGLRPADYALTAEEWIERYALGKDRKFDEERAVDAMKVPVGRSLAECQASVAGRPGFLRRLLAASRRPP